MSFGLFITQQARDDIERNAAWWATHHSLDEALLWYDRVYAQLNELLQFPEGHALAAENDAFSIAERHLRPGDLTQLLNRTLQVSCELTPMRADVNPAAACEAIDEGF